MKHSTLALLMLTELANADVDRPFVMQDLDPSSLRIGGNIFVAELSKKVSSEPDHPDTLSIMEPEIAYSPLRFLTLTGTLPIIRLAHQGYSSHPTPYALGNLTVRAHAFIPSKLVDGRLRVGASLRVSPAIAFGTEHDEDAIAARAAAGYLYTDLGRYWPDAHTLGASISAQFRYDRIGVQGELGVDHLVLTEDTDPTRPDQTLVRVGLLASVHLRADLALLAELTMLGDTLDEEVEEGYDWAFSLDAGVRWERCGWMYSLRLYAPFSADRGESGTYHPTGFPLGVGIDVMRRWPQP